MCTFEDQRNIYTVNDERVINSNDFTDGTLCMEKNGNVMYYYVIRKGVLYRLEDGAEWLINTYKYEDNKWKVIGTLKNPYELLDDESLKKGDIVKFVNSTDGKLLKYIEELNLNDPHGIFIVGEALDDYAARASEDLLIDDPNELDSTPDDDDDDDYDVLDYDYDVEFMSASAILTYLKNYGDVISTASDLIDESANIE